VTTPGIPRRLPNLLCHFIRILDSRQRHLRCRGICRRELNVAASSPRRDALLHTHVLVEPARSLNACLLTVAGKFSRAGFQAPHRRCALDDAVEKTGSARIRKGFAPQAAQEGRRATARTKALSRSRARCGRAAAGGHACSSASRCCSGGAFNSMRSDQSR
jgi:hypothetical protein